MAIWKTEMSLEKADARQKKTMSEHVGIHIVEVGDDYLVATMPIDHRTIQPHGIMHGGASCVLAETVGSIAGNCCVDSAKHYCVGLDITTSHIRMALPGTTVKGTAKPIHLGKKTQVWEIRIVNEEDKLVSLTRLTLMVMDR